MEGFEKNFHLKIAKSFQAYADAFTNYCKNDKDAIDSDAYWMTMVDELKFIGKTVDRLSFDIGLAVKKRYVKTHDVPPVKSTFKFYTNPNFKDLSEKKKEKND